jgi:hypothetical protein
MWCALARERNKWKWRSVLKSQSSQNTSILEKRRKEKKMLIMIKKK